MSSEVPLTKGLCLKKQRNTGSITIIVITTSSISLSSSEKSTGTIKNVQHGLGDQEVKLIVTTDDGTWDGYIDFLEITNP